jgi:hypothetical protein
VDHAAGAIEQHGGIGHSGNDGADCRGFNRVDAENFIAGGDRIVQSPRHQGCASDADKNNRGDGRRDFAEQHQCRQREPSRQQDDGRMPQPVRPGWEY